MGDFEKVKELLGQVPQPPERPIPGGVQDENLRAFEVWLGYSLPEPLREWLRVSNGPFVGPGGAFGIDTGRKSLEIKTYLDANPQWKDRKWIPVAGDGCGNSYVLVASGEFGPGLPVIFVETSADPDAPSFIAASSLVRLLIFLMESNLSKTRWPFDREAVLQRDPEIGSFHGLQLPWEV